MVTAAKCFAEEGFTVLMTGFDKYGKGETGLQFVHQLHQAIPKGDAVILPLPYGRSVSGSTPSDRILAGSG